MENKYKPKDIRTLFNESRYEVPYVSEPFRQEPFSDSEIDKALMSMRADSFDLFFAEKKL
jgi:hypothetical protein